VSRGRHARDGQRRDTLRSRVRDTWTRLRRAARNALWATGDRLCARQLTFPAGNWLGELGWKLSGPFRAATVTPAPELRPEQAPRPADPPLVRTARCGPGQPPAPGAVADGTGTSAGGPPPPAAAALPPAPEDATATLPPPEPGPPQAGRGQPVYAVRRDGIIAVSSTGRLAVIPAASTLPAVRLRPTAALDAVTAPDPVWAAAGPDLHSQVTETSAVRPYYTAHEASRDEAANAPVDYWPAYLPAAAAR
jgi:hypothetical protein